MDASIAISARNEDITVSAGGEVRAKIEVRVVRVIKHEQPLLTLPRQPIKRGLLRLANSFGHSYIDEACADGLLRAGVNIKDVREPSQVGV